MKNKVIKRALAFVMAGALVLSGISVVPPTEVQAGDDNWNEETSISGYPKISRSMFASTVAGSQHNDFPGSNATDGDKTSYWHSDYAQAEHGISSGKTYLDINLVSPQAISGVSYLPRQLPSDADYSGTQGSVNGCITNYEIYVKKSGEEDFQEQPVDSGTFSYDSNPSWEKEIIFNEMQKDVVAVRLKATGSKGGTGQENQFANAAEISLLKKPAGDVSQLNLTSPQLQAAPEDATLAGYTREEGASLSFSGREGTTYSPTQDDGGSANRLVKDGIHNAFMGKYSFANDNETFNVTGRTPFVVKFWMKLDEDVADNRGNSYSIIGKMNTQYGIQAIRAGGNDYVQVYFQNNGWPTYTSYDSTGGQLDLTKWTYVTTFYDGYSFWLGTAQTGNLADMKLYNNIIQHGDGQALRADPNSDFTIGYNKTTPTITFPGLLADVKMYVGTSDGMYGAKSQDAEEAASRISEIETPENLILQSNVKIYSPYTMTTKWSKEGSEEEVTSFEVGKYKAEVSFTADDGYALVAPSSILIDGVETALNPENVSFSENHDVMTISYSFEVVDTENGLIGYYTFDDENPDTYFANTAPLEQEGRLGNAMKNADPSKVEQSADAVDGKSASFLNEQKANEIGNLTISNGFDAKKSFTIAFWMKADDFFKANATNKGIGASIFHQKGSRAILFYRNDVKAVGSFLTGDNLYYYRNSGEIDTEQWHHVVYVSEVSDANVAVTYYVDGQKEATFPTVSLNTYGGASSYPLDLVIGTHAKGEGQTANYKGLLDNVRIYNKALDDAEALGIYSDECPTWQVAVQGIDAPEGIVPSVSKSEVEHMGEVTFTAPQKAGYNFAGWFTDPDAADTSKVSEAAEYTTKIYKNLTLYAKYELLPDISVTGDVEENQLDNPGSVTFTVNGGDSHNAGETVSDVRAELDSLVFTAQVNDGYYFVEWVDEDGQLLSRDNPYSVTAGRNDLNCYARFKKAAQRTVNVARGKTVTTPEGKATDGTLPSYLVNGDDGDYFGFAKNTATNLYTDTAHVCLDLGKEYENIDYLRMKCYNDRTYYGIVIVISDDPDFSTDDTVVYNSDRTYPNANNAASSLENVHGFGVGTETPYAENGGFHTFAIPEGISGRYIGIYMRGNSENVGNHIREFEVYVQPADPTRLEAKVTEAEQKLEEIEAGDITYSAASVKALSDAKDAANAAVESIDENGESGSIVVLTESEIDAYIQNIENAINNLTEYDPNVQAQYWDEEKEKETLATQDDNDIWQYQIKESGAWTTLSDGVFHPDAADGEGIWMSDGSNIGDGYYYAAIGRTKLTPCFEVETHQAVAYAWNAASADVADAKYVKLVLKKNVHTAEATNKNPVVMQVIAETQDGTETVLNQQTLPIGGSEVEKDLFTSVAKKAGLKYLRLAALKANNDVFDVEAAVETATAKEYAEQYVPKMQAKQQTWAEEHLYTDQSTEAFDEALNALQTALAQPETPDNTIDSLITAMEKADAGLKNYVQATTLTLTADRETTLTAIDGSVIMKAKITAPQDATPAKSYAWTLEGNAEMVSKEETEAGDADDAIVLKATAKGSGTVTVKVTATLEDGTNLESTPVEVKVQVPYTVTAGYVTGSEEKGTVQVSATQDAQDAGTTADVEANGTAYFKAVPGDGYQFAGWFASKDGNDEAVDANASYEKTPVTEDFSLYAKFVVDKTELDALLTSCNELNAADYTKASWDAYTAVRNKAEAINEKLEATVDEIAGAVRDLTAASTVGTSESGLRRYQPLAENDAKIMSVDTPLEKITSREAGLIYPGGENEEDIVAYSLQVKLGKDYYKDDLKIDWNPGDDKIRVQAIKDYPSRATLNVEAGAIGEISVTVTTTNGAGESTQTTAVCQVEVGYKIETGYVEGSEGRGSVKVELKKSDGNALNADSLLLASEADQAILTPEAAEGYILVGLYKDSKGEEAWHESLDASYTYTGSGNSATDADKDGVITFYAKFAADKSELAKQIEEAKARMAEQDYETKYTQESRDTLDTAYKAAQSVDGDPDPTKENVQQAAQKLKEAIEGLTEETPKETLTLKLEVSKTEGDDAQPMGRIWCDSEEWTDGQTKEDFDVDQKVTVKAEANEGYEFQYWEDLNGNKVVSEIAEYTFNIFSHMKLKAVFKETAKVTYTVEFKTSDKFANQVADRQVLSVDREGESINVTVPQPLSYFDYEFKGWALEGQDNISIEPDKAGQQISVTGDTTYIAVYEPKDDGKLSVTIKDDTGSITSGNKTETNRYELDTLLAVTAGKAPEGKPYFDGWYLIDESKPEGIKVSSTTVYKFYVKKDMVLEARFSETEVAHDEPVATFTTSRTVKEGAPTKDACKLQLTWDAPEGCKIVTQGVMRMYGTGATKTEEELAAAGKAMVYGTSNKNVTTNNYGSTKWSGVYTYNLTIGSAEKVGLTLYARGYVVYKDKNGEQKVLYTDVYALEKITRE